MLGIFGGTFDPIHFGHLRSAWEIAERFSITVHMIPAGDPPHRDPPHANAQQRLAMLELALQGQQRLIADDREVNRKGRSYMVDTLTELRHETGQELALIVGHDAFAGLPKWHRWQQLFELANIVIIERPGAEQEFSAELRREVDQRTCEDFTAGRGQLAFCELTQIDISASAIRRLLAKQRSPQFLTPGSVLNYIRHNELYRAPG